MGLTFNDTEKKIVTELLNKLHTRHEDYSLEFGFIGDFLSINFIPNKELPIITNSIITDLGIKSLNNAKKYLPFISSKKIYYIPSLNGQVMKDEYIVSESIQDCINYIPIQSQDIITQKLIYFNSFPKGGVVLSFLGNTMDKLGTNLYPDELELFGNFKSEKAHLDYNNKTHKIDSETLREFTTNNEFCVENNITEEESLVSLSRGFYFGLAEGQRNNIAIDFYECTIDNGWSNLSPLTEDFYHRLYLNFDGFYDLDIGGNGSTDPSGQDFEIVSELLLFLDRK